MITHHFVTDDDILNGYFSDESGQKLYSYHFDPDSQLLTVTRKPFSRSVDLSAAGIGRLSEDELRDRLIELAKEVGEDLRVPHPDPR